MLFLCERSSAFPLTADPTRLSLPQKSWVTLTKTPDSPRHLGADSIFSVANSPGAQFCQVCDRPVGRVIA